MANKDRDKDKDKDREPDNEETEFDVEIYKEKSDPDALFKKGFVSNQFNELVEDEYYFMKAPSVSEAIVWGHDPDLFGLDHRSYNLVEPFYYTGEMGSIGSSFSRELALRCGLANETCSNPFALLTHKGTTYYGIEWSYGKCFLGHALNGSFLFGFKPGKEGYKALGLFEKARKDIYLKYSKDPAFGNEAPSYENKDDSLQNKIPATEKLSVRQFIDSEDFSGKCCHFHARLRSGSVFPHSLALAKIFGLGFTKDNSDARAFTHEGELYRGVGRLDGVCFLGHDLDGSLCVFFKGNAGKELLRKVIDTKEPDLESFFNKMRFKTDESRKFFEL